jgi:periplasmic divalent cation tolerance protein
MTDKIVVLSTCASAEEAERIARLLVERQAAACVNVIPGMRSYYRWKDSIEESSEFLLIIKSSRELFDIVRTELVKAHSYELPELIVLPIIDGSPEYLGWIDSVLAPPKAG